MEVEKILSVEDLMKPRYKVIADWPTNLVWHVGTTLNLWELGEGRTIDIWIKYCEKYPHLFKKLFWWEERKESDMPMYVKVNTEKSSLFFGDVHKVTEWFKRGDGLACRIEERKDPMYSFSVEHFTPSTESEYLTLNK